MDNEQEYISNALALKVMDRADAIDVLWIGKSNERDPGKFILPILTSLLAQAAGARPIRMDFRQLTYMNSSTITPIIRVLDEAKRGSHRVSITYDKSAKWQELSFSALKAFATKD
jgi:hypothetical protein